MGWMAAGAVFPSEQSCVGAGTPLSCKLVNLIIIISGLEFSYIGQSCRYPRRAVRLGSVTCRAPFFSATLQGPEGTDFSQDEHCYQAGILDRGLPLAARSCRPHRLISLEYADYLLTLSAAETTDS